MERVLSLYWKPVYKFIRVKFGKSNDEAKDLTQGFFASALEREFFQRFDSSKASFRTYIRMGVERYAAARHEAEGRQKRGGGIETLQLYDSVAGSATPEDIFLQEWRRQLFALALEEMCTEFAAAGKLTQWAVFETYDLADGERPSYAEVARSCGVTVSAVTNYLALARRRLRALVTERLRGVTGGDRELREELHGLWS